MAELVSHETKGSQMDFYTFPGVPSLQAFRARADKAQAGGTRTAGTDAPSSVFSYSQMIPRTPAEAFAFGMAATGIWATIATVWWLIAIHGVADGTGSIGRRDRT